MTLIRILFLLMRWRWRRKYNPCFKGLDMRSSSPLMRRLLPMWGRGELIIMLFWVQLILRRVGRISVSIESSCFFSWHACFLFSYSMDKISKWNMFYNLVDAQGIRVALNIGTSAPTPTPLLTTALAHSPTPL